MKMKFVCFLIILLLSPFSTKAQNFTHQYLVESVLFTNTLIDGEPKNVIQEASFEQERVYIYVKWKGLDDRSYEIKTKIYDPEDNLVNEINSIFKPRNGRYNTWMWKKFNISKNIPGKWRFEVYLDYEFMLSRNIMVSQ